MDKPSADDILKAIRASGYLMEQEVATTLESLGFHVQTSRAYQDMEEAKSREIDVWAISRKYHDEQANFAIFVELICECKNSSNPFVFLTRKKTLRDRSLIPEEYMFPKQDYHVPITGKPNAFHVVTPFSFQDALAKYNYRFQNDDKAVQFAKIVRDKNSWQANHAGLYDAIFYPLVKAFLSRKSEIRDFSRVIWLFFPVLITSGELYKIDSLAAELAPQRVDHVPMLRHIRSKNIDGEFNIDFVTEKGLRTFIETKVMPFYEAVEQLAKTKPEVFVDRKKGT